MDADDVALDDAELAPALEGAGADALGPRAQASTSAPLGCACCKGSGAMEAMHQHGPLKGLASA